MNLSESTRKYIIGGTIIFIILTFLFSYFLGKNQDKSFQQDDAFYNAMIQHLQEEKYEDALDIADGLKKQQTESDIVNYAIAIASANSNAFEKAANHMQRALDYNPHRVEDSMFMLQFAEILIFANRNEDAKAVLERCIDLDAPEGYPHYVERIQQLRTQING